MTREEAKIYLESVFPVLNAKMQEAIKTLCTEQEPRKDEVILTNKEYRELVSNEYENGYAKGYREALEQEPLEVEAAEKAYNKGFEDCRQAVLDMATTIQTDDYSGNEIIEVVDIDDVKALPPINPQTKMRDATLEERESVNKYVESISKPTGVDFWDLEQEPKTGKWILIDKELSRYKCSECGEIIKLHKKSEISSFTKDETLSDYPFSHCGARMESCSERSE